MASRRVSSRLLAKRLAVLSLAALVLTAAASGLVPTSVVAKTEMSRQAPPAGCLPGDTPAARIEELIRIIINGGSGDDHLASVGTRDASGRLTEPRCAAAAVLAYWDSTDIVHVLGLRDDVIDTLDSFLSMWNEGMSLAEIAERQGVAREEIVGLLGATYGESGAEAVAAGLLSASQFEWVEARVLPHFEWIVDYNKGDVRGAGDLGGGGLGVTGDRNGDGRDDLGICMPGDDATAQVDGIIAILIGFDTGLPPVNVDLLGITGEAAATCAALEAVGARYESPIPEQLGMTAEDIWLDYQGGETLAGMAKAKGIHPDELVVLTLDVWEHAYYLAVDAGMVDAESGFLDRWPGLIAALFEHGQGEPLRPDDPFGIG